MAIPVLDVKNWFEKIHRPTAPLYYAMYSSWLKGIVTDPLLMQVPVDDHIVHRGDGVFEAFRMMKSAFYDFRSHLKRLESSAGQIGIRLPYELSEIQEICKSTARAAKVEDALVRLFVSRGPGGFAANPYESYGSQLYVVFTKLTLPKEELYQKGVKLKTSQVPVKEPPFSQIKSCNYLQNVLMKKEAVDAGVDFTVSVNSSGVVYEGSTENIALISEQGDFLAPRFDYTLKGTTLSRVMTLAKDKLKTDFKALELGDIQVKDLIRAREVFMVGTTLGVLPVTEFDGKTLGGGRPGPISQKLHALLTEDMLKNPEFRLPIA